MATALVVLMCALAEGFLFYVLLRFTRELRKTRTALVTTVISMTQAEADTTGEQAQPQKLIEISAGRRGAGRGERRLAS